MSVLGLRSRGIGENGAESATATISFPRHQRGFPSEAPSSGGTGVLFQRRVLGIVIVAMGTGLQRVLTQHRSLLGNAQQRAAFSAQARPRALPEPRGYGVCLPPVSGRSLYEDFSGLRAENRVPFNLPAIAGTSLTTCGRQAGLSMQRPKLRARPARSRGQVPGGEAGKQEGPPSRTGTPGRARGHREGRSLRGGWSQTHGLGPVGGHPSLCAAGPRAQ